MRLSFISLATPPGLAPQQRATDKQHQNTYTYNGRYSGPGSSDGRVPAHLRCILIRSLGGRGMMARMIIAGIRVSIIRRGIPAMQHHQSVIGLLQLP